jgi:transcriptional regulator of acetoin/glycerol metabolism
MRLRNSWDFPADTRPGAEGRGSASIGEDGRASAVPAAGPASSCDALREAEHAALLRELAKTHWNISRTARALGISRNTLYRKMHKHGIVLAGVELGR